MSRTNNKQNYTSCLCCLYKSRTNNKYKKFISQVVSAFCIRHVQTINTKNYTSGCLCILYTSRTNNKHKNIFQRLSLLLVGRVQTVNINGYTLRLSCFFICRVQKINTKKCVSEVVLASYRSCINNKDKTTKLYT